MNSPIGDILFRDIPRCVAKFRENRSRDVEKSVERKRINHNTTVKCRYVGTTRVVNRTVARLQPHTDIY